MSGASRVRLLVHVNFPTPEWESALPPVAPFCPDKVTARIDRCWAEYQLMLQQRMLTLKEKA